MSDLSELDQEDAGDAFMEHLHEGSSLAHWVSGAGHALNDSNMFEGLGLLSGFTEFTGGLYHMMKDPSVGAGLDMAKGATTVVKDGAGLAGAHGVAKKLGPLSAILDGASTANDLRKGDYAHAVRDSVSTGLDIWAPEVAAPWKLGWFAGETGEHAASQYAAKHDYLGGNRTIEEHYMDTGGSVDGWVSDHLHSKTAGRVAGALTAAGTAVGDTAYTGARFVGGKIADGAGWLRDEIFGEDVEATAATIDLPTPQEQIGPVTEVAHEEAPKLPQLQGAVGHYAD